MATTHATIKPPRMLEILGEQSINSLERAVCSLGTVIVDVSGSEETKDQRPKVLGPNALTSDCRQRQRSRRRTTHQRRRKTSHLAVAEGAISGPQTKPSKGECACVRK